MGTTDDIKFCLTLSAIALGGIIILAAIIYVGTRNEDKYQEYYPQFQISGTFSTQPNLKPKNEAAESTVFKWDVDISVRNPNKYFDNYYNDFHVKVCGNNKVLAEYRLPSLVQVPKKTTVLRASFSENMPDFSSLFPTRQYDIRLEALFGTNRRVNIPCTLLVNCDPFDAATGGAMKPCVAHCSDEGLVDRPYIQY